MERTQQDEWFFSRRGVHQPYTDEDMERMFSAYLRDCTGLNPREVRLVATVAALRARVHELEEQQRETDKIVVCVQKFK